MPQTLKPEVRDRILVAAEHEFFEHGYDGATMASIAKQAETAAANLYRYFEDKAALFEAVITADFVERLDQLVQASVDALARPDDDGSAAETLLEFWLSNRRKFVTLLEHQGPTPLGRYPDRFVERLVDEFESSLARDMSPHERTLCRVIFENTRRALAALLRSCPDDATAREVVRGFWSYQVPGLVGLQRWIGQDPADP